MAWFDYVGGIAEGVGAVAQGGLAHLDAQKKERLRLKEEARRSLMEQRADEEYARKEAQILYDNSAIGSEYDINDPFIRQLLPYQKRYLEKGSTPNSIRILESPERAAARELQEAGKSNSEQRSRADAAAAIAREAMGSPETFAEYFKKTSRPERHLAAIGMGLPPNDLDSPAEKIADAQATAQYLSAAQNNLHDQANTDLTRQATARFRATEIVDKDPSKTITYARANRTTPGSGDKLRERDIDNEVKRLMSDSQGGTARTVAGYAITVHP